MLLLHCCQHRHSDPYEYVNVDRQHVRVLPAVYCHDGDKGGLVETERIRPHPVGPGGASRRGDGCRFQYHTGINILSGYAGRMAVHRAIEPLRNDRNGLAYLVGTVDLSQPA